MSAPEEPPGLDSLPDEELLRRTADGDSEAFARFARRHEAAVFRHASYLVPGREDAEDVLQETLLAAFRSAGQFRGDASARTWLLRIARNAALRRVGEPRAVTDVPLETLALTAGWGSANPESLAMLAEDRERLDRALAELPEVEREVLLLRAWEGASGEEVASLLNLSLTAVKSRLHRARIHLAALLRGLPPTIAIKEVMKGDRTHAA